jgi:hypothetical protein
VFLLRKDAIRIKECGGHLPVVHAVLLKGQIGCNLEVYVDDIIMKTRQGDSLTHNLEETFSNLLHFNIRLNPEK